MLLFQLSSYQGDVLQVLTMKEEGSNKLHSPFKSILQVDIHIFQGN